MKTILCALLLLLAGCRTLGEKGKLETGFDGGVEASLEKSPTLKISFSAKYTR